MRPTLPFCALLAGLTAPLAAQQIHTIQLQGDTARDEYRMRPTQVTARPGDVLVFRSESGGFHAIAFEDAGLTAAARSALDAAMPRRVSELNGPLLPPGAEYRMTVPALPPGRYRFYCLPHRAYDEAGYLVIRR